MMVRTLLLYGKGDSRKGWVVIRTGSAHDAPDPQHHAKGALSFQIAPLKPQVKAPSGVSHIAASVTSLRGQPLLGSEGECCDLRRGATRWSRSRPVSRRCSNRHSSCHAPRNAIRLYDVR